jgi:hypothetical protein
MPYLVEAKSPFWRETRVIKLEPKKTVDTDDGIMLIVEDDDNIRRGENGLIWTGDDVNCPDLKSFFSLSRTLLEHVLFVRKRLVHTSSAEEKPKKSK